ncbi:putative GPI anchored dioxygenase [Xylariomycetidae sp. FL0641]|nr:putative GPI anchored dioxygenase [Xylariomycetidae sp. FL0641]
MVLASPVAAVLAVVLSFMAVGIAHPGEKYGKREAMEEIGNAHVVAEMNARALEACQNSEEVQARKQRAMERRAATFARLRKEREIENANWLHRRDASSLRKWAAQQHDKTGSISLNKDSPSSEIFGSNTSCVLTPDNANGPYFVYQEHIRSDVVEDVVGVPMHLEIQFIDVQTCKPATEILIDTWSCNATGAYSGVSARGEGGLGTTFLRGVQPTDQDGIVSFDTVFPGHYQGRATHQHIIAHVGSEVLDNGTYTGGRVAHLSQLFFDQTLRDAIEATAPYNTNRIPKTTNLRDMFTGYAATANYDPFPNYIMLGDNLADGLFVWAELGLNTSSNWDTYAPYAATWKEGGGYNNPNFNMMAVARPPPSHG